jgi:hypothetical protein
MGCREFRVVGVALVNVQQLRGNGYVDTARLHSGNTVRLLIREEKGIVATPCASWYEQVEPLVGGQEYYVFDELCWK